MAYCSYCAAVLDAGQPVCSRCGRPAPTAPAPATMPAQVVVGTRSSNVRIATILLLISCVISLFSLAGTFLMGRLPAVFLFRTVGLWVVWVVLTILVWQRQSWARIAIALLIAWSVANLLISILRVGTSVGLLFSLGLTVVIVGLRVCAVYLLFKKDS